MGLTGVFGQVGNTKKAAMSRTVKPPRERSGKKKVKKMKARKASYDPWPPLGHERSHERLHCFPGPLVGNCQTRITEVCGRK